jgi:hypothetical protein
MVEFEQGAGGEPITPGLAMKMFTAAEESVQIRAALISRFSAEAHIRDLASLKRGGTLNKITQMMKYASLNPEGYLENFVRNRTFTNPITKAELDDIWSGKKQLTVEDVNRIMHRASVDTQFIQDFASRAIPWKTNPFLRLGLKFKTFAINQTRLIYTDAVKQAAKGTFGPLLKYLLFSTMAGELWNLTKDLIVGGDNALSTQLINRPEKRNLADISLALANDFIDGAGVGIITDMAWGIGNWTTGAVGQTGKNILEWASNLKHPIMGTKKFLKQEISVFRDIEGLMARADKIFLNDNNRFFEYKRTRDRTFDWQQKQKHPGFLGGAGQVAKGFFVPRTKFPSILPYEYAAKQITLGDVDDAAAYLVNAIKTSNLPKEEILASIESSRDNYSPLGNISKGDMGDFMDTFPKKDQREMEKLDDAWLDDYDDAIDIAEKVLKKRSK